MPLIINFGFSIWSSHFLNDYICGMILDKISILNFKNLEQVDLDFSSGINCFMGDNGAGKTNLLDAIHLLSMSKSALNLTDGQCVSHGSDFFMVRGDYSLEGQSSEVVVCSFKRSAGKTLKRNGKDYDRISQHIGLLPLVLVAPGDTALINESADERRRFLNSFLSQIDSMYLNQLMRYNSLIMQRNKLLKNFAGFDEVIQVLDLQISEVAQVIYAKREEFVALLSPVVTHYYGIISGDSENVEISYRSELARAPMSELLAESMERDVVMGHTTVGVHRDDIIMKIRDYPIRKYGSQGQQKSMLIALKLAQFDIIKQVRGLRPLLLLDDVFDKLDMSRVEQLITLVSGDNFGQIFITDSNKVRLEGVLDGLQCKYKLFDVVTGNITSK